MKPINYLSINLGKGSAFRNSFLCKISSIRTWNEGVAKKTSYTFIPKSRFLIIGLHHLHRPFAFALSCLITLNTISPLVISCRSDLRRLFRSKSSCLKLRLNFWASQLADWKAGHCTIGIILIHSNTYLRSSSRSIRALCIIAVRSKNLCEIDMTVTGNKLYWKKQRG